MQSEDRVCSGAVLFLPCRRLERGDRCNMALERERESMTLGPDPERCRERESMTERCLGCESMTERCLARESMSLDPDPEGCWDASVVVSPLYAGGCA